MKITRNRSPLTTTIKNMTAMMMILIHENVIEQLKSTRAFIVILSIVIGVSCPL
ncbi:hypothetical protein ACLRAA_02790 [Gallibacterium anatis]|uniref:hypothetical protein n=1 Tax=Gallibacterium anatis TaxID=750 RepID=UPI0039FC3E1F